MTPNPYPFVNVQSPPASGFVPHCGLCGRAQHLCTCGSTPAGAATPDVARRSRIVERYGERYCATCGFPAAHCGCDRTPPEQPAQDGTESDLSRRVRQARGGR